MKKLVLDTEINRIYACWVAIPALFSTVQDFDDPNQVPGIHVHARTRVNQPKIVDDTFDLVEVKYESQTYRLTYSNCVDYLIATILKNEIDSLVCPACLQRHHDEDKYAVIPHKLHSCEHCGANFLSEFYCVSNNIKHIRRSMGCLDSETVPQTNHLALDQKDFSGVAILACGPAIVWSSSIPEEDGVHVHAYKDGQISFDSTALR